MLTDSTCWLGQVASHASLGPASRVRLYFASREGNYFRICSATTASFCHDCPILPRPIGMRYYAPMARVYMVPRSNPSPVRRRKRRKAKANPSRRGLARRSNASRPSRARYPHASAAMMAKRERCVLKVKARKGKKPYNPWAVCTRSVSRGGHYNFYKPRGAKVLPFRSREVKHVGGRALARVANPSRRRRSRKRR